MGKQPTMKNPSSHSYDFSTNYNWFIVIGFVFIITPSTFTTNK